MKKKIILSIFISLVPLALSIALGSVSISPKDAFAVSMHHIFGRPLDESISAITDNIFWQIRAPRALTAFLVGALLSVAGAVMQASLQNPLASSYTLGVSSGASLGAGLMIVSGIQIAFLKTFSLPIAGFIFAVITVLFVINLSAKIDHNLHNQTIILLGMVISLFVSAIITLLLCSFPGSVILLYFWMMGSFSARNWTHVSILLPTALLGTLILSSFSRELDIMTFGDEQSNSLGVNVKVVKKFLILFAALLTGIAVSFTGTIGFIDLVAPHVVRKIFGARHKIVLPMTFFIGGAFMALADLISRTLLAPKEIPVGAVTALIGAPFFAYIFFHKSKEKEDVKE